MNAEISDPFRNRPPHDQENADHYHNKAGHPAYILSRKIDFAGHQLAETDDPIEDIAGTIGFKTPTGFATSFKKVTGMSPTEYRKQIKYNCINNPSQIQDLDI